MESTFVERTEKKTTIYEHLESNGDDASTCLVASNKNTYPPMIGGKPNIFGVMHGDWVIVAGVQPITSTPRSTILGSISRIIWRSSSMPTVTLIFEKLKFSSSVGFGVVSISVASFAAFVDCADAAKPFILWPLDANIFAFAIRIIFESVRLMLAANVRHRLH